MPIVSGNVSLYNETDGTGILPTPTIGAVGLIDDIANIITGPARAGDTLLLLGDTRGHLGQSALLREAFGRSEGDAPAVDLAVERAHGDFIRANHADMTACTDLSDGGLALAAFELAHNAQTGVALNTAKTAKLFGEDQARYLIACSAEQATKLQDRARTQGLTLIEAGTLGGDTFACTQDNSAPMAKLSELYSNAFEAAVT